MTLEEILNSLAVAETNVSEMRECQLRAVMEQTKKLLSSDDWSDEDMQFLQLVYKMLDAVDLRLHIYAEWLRETLEKMDNDN
ncbi:MAG: hypothetical protein SOW36_00155 [Porphyromonas sp.]|uniref:hypothetical protein n=1 Tax=Porphyromonas sp. TaxID=1924944 RepID=UPI002A75A472|nr:hypothetical protein [Porphyromonas sp.]MDY3111043.1 hypothetical protein [Porphyromonas sp.]MDY4246256.1 hypothetical protein [Porphyromonas sp.]